MYRLDKETERDYINKLLEHFEISAAECFSESFSEYSKACESIEDFLCSISEHHQLGLSVRECDEV